MEKKKGKTSSRAKTSGSRKTTKSDPAPKTEEANTEEVRTSSEPEKEVKQEPLQLGKIRVSPKASILLQKLKKSKWDYLEKHKGNKPHPTSLASSRFDEEGGAFLVVTSTELAMTLLLTTDERHLLKGWGVKTPSSESDPA